MEKQLKILFLVGIPSSGKTTYAKKLIKENPNWIRVNKDDIRAMLSRPYSKELESLIEDIQINVITNAISRNINIVIDNTNLNNSIKRYILHVIEDYCDYTHSNYSIDYKYFDIGLEEAIKRDSQRECTVGRDVILKFYNKYKNIIQK